MVLSGLTGVGKQQKKKKKCTGFYRGGKPGRVCGSWKVELGLPFAGLEALPYENCKRECHFAYENRKRECHFTSICRFSGTVIKKKWKNEKTLPMTPLIVTNSSSRGSISAQRRIAFNVSKWKVQLKASESALLIPIASICFSSYISIWRLKKGFLQVAIT